MCFLFKNLTLARRLRFFYLVCLFFCFCFLFVCFFFCLFFFLSHFLNIVDVTCPNDCLFRVNAESADNLLFFSFFLFLSFCLSSSSFSFCFLSFNSSIAAHTPSPHSKLGYNWFFTSLNYKSLGFLNGFKEWLIHFAKIFFCLDLRTLGVVPVAQWLKC